MIHTDIVQVDALSHGQRDCSLSLSNEVRPENFTTREYKRRSVRVARLVNTSNDPKTQFYEPLRAVVLDMNAKDPTTMLIATSEAKANNIPQTPWDTLIAGRKQI